MMAGKLRNAVMVVLLAMQLFAQSNLGMEMQNAIKKEQVDGDLKAAIAIYKKIAADTSAARDLRAKALLHLARCYEKLGRRAQKVYGKIVRDFADQPEAAQARARLAALRKNNGSGVPVGMTQRKIEVPRPYLDPGDTDGLRAIYENSATRELIYSDLADKRERVIFQAEEEAINDRAWSFPSRDFSTVLLAPHADVPERLQTLAIVKTNGSGYRQIAQLDPSHYSCWSWSWDNRYVLLCDSSQDGTGRLLRISIADGQIRELLSRKTGSVSAAQFSPDGRFVAYQLPASPDGDPVSRIFIMRAEGKEARLVYEERQAAQVSRIPQPLKLLDWTADGRYLAIASDRTGRGALHLLPIKDGKSSGLPVFIQYGAFEAGVMSASGGLVFSSVKPGSPCVAYLASLDANGRPGDWKRLDLHLGDTESASPQ